MLLLIITNYYACLNFSKQWEYSCNRNILDKYRQKSFKGLILLNVKTNLKRTIKQAMNGTAREDMMAAGNVYIMTRLIKL